MKKTLKLFSLAALFVATTAMVGCSKDEELANNDKVVTSTTTVSLEGSDASKAMSELGVKTFAADEQIAVVYKNSSGNFVTTTVTLNSTDITNSGKTANISVTMTNPESNGTLRIIYPAAMAGESDVDYGKLANQDGTRATLAASYDLGYYDGSLDGENLPTNVSLSNPLVVAKFVLKDAGTSINSNVTMLFIGDGTNSYYITRSGSADSIYVAMRPVTSSQTLTFNAIAGSDKYDKEVTGKTLTAGHIIGLGLGMDKLHTGATFGRFSIASGIQKHFSQGNLRYASGIWSFHTQQYAVVGGATQNTSKMDLFYWETNGNYGAEQDYSDSDPGSTTTVNWGVNNITNGGGANQWSTPTKDNWTYIFNTRSASTVGGTANGHYAKAYLFGTTHGVILFPDHYTHPTDVTAPTGVNSTDNTSWNGNQYTAEQWAKMEAAGAVFLPAAGYRYGSDVYGVGSDGGYWSATQYDEFSAYYVYFYSGFLNPANYNFRYHGCAVRLVQD